MDEDSGPQDGRSSSGSGTSRLIRSRKSPSILIVLLHRRTSFSIDSTLLTVFGGNAAATFLASLPSFATFIEQFGVGRVS